MTAPAVHQVCTTTTGTDVLRAQYIYHAVVDEPLVHPLTAWYMLRAWMPNRSHSTSEVVLALSGNWCQYLLSEVVTTEASHAS